MNHRTRRFIAALVMLALAVGLPVVDAPPSYAAARLALSPIDPVKGETINLSARIGSIKRPVHLQYWNATRRAWLVLAKKSTTSTGRFTFATRAVAPSRKFRVSAPRFTSNGRVYRLTTTYPRLVKTVKATSGFGLLPIQAGSATQDDAGKTLASARFSPVRVGRKVLLQRRLSTTSAWSTVTGRAQNAGGTVTFTAPKRSGTTLWHYRAVAVRANGAPPVASRPARATDRRRTFEDHFKTSYTDQWEVRGTKRDPSGGRACSQGSAKSVSVIETAGLGLLRLETKRIPDEPYGLLGEDTDDYVEDANCPYGQWYNGHLGTKEFRFERGIMTARIRVQPQRGHHAGFWSMPDDRSSTTTGVEIDAMEYFGDAYNNGAIQHSVYSASGTQLDLNRKSRNHLLANETKWSGTYHVFSVEWTATEYIFRIDGHETHRTRRGISTTSQNVILSLLTSGWELPHLPQNVPLAPMYVDWVRVWQ